ncbi:hypothetical protein KVT40_007282 [Elsinoe batatas]|uniref:Uncharacterized protein n=1 Tax=Elsinoe batatas TaxID=2601811 RepID=A0A8K0PDC3_9PEZI|nr:hypothetical protein KVT40_007282 [Elsinoe batatas]
MSFLSPIQQPDRALLLLRPYHDQRGREERGQWYHARHPLRPAQSNRSRIQNGGQQTPACGVVARLLPPGHEDLGAESWGGVGVAVGDEADHCRRSQGSSARTDDDNYHITKGVAMLVALKSTTMPLEHRHALDLPIKYGNAGFIPPTFIAGQEDASLLNDIDNHIKSNSALGRRASGITHLGLKSWDLHQGLLLSQYIDEDLTSLLCRNVTKMICTQPSLVAACGDTNQSPERFIFESSPKTRSYQHPYVQASTKALYVRKASSSWTATSAR